jgi:hypothetical protein
VHVAPIEQVATTGSGRGAVVLVGDAAHGMSPNMAEGAALALEDALVLATCLRDAATTGLATSHRSSATSPYGPSDVGSSSPTTDPCWIRSRRLRSGEVVCSAIRNAPGTEIGDTG